MSASYGGVLGYTANGAYYGILGHANQYSFCGTGTLYNAGTAYANSFLYISDERLKEAIQPLKDGVAKLMRLKPVSFIWRDDARKGEADIGFIAQEVEQVVPEIVHTDADGLKAVDYPKLVPLLVKAIQEQQVDNDRQQREIDALREEVRRLLDI